MSSTPSGPYKSRLFNFLNQQYHSLRGQSEHAMRHVKVGAVWGTQILLYPVYLLAQSARVAGYQLQQAAKRGWKQLNSANPSQPETPASSDTPIQRVLNAVDVLPVAGVADVATDGGNGWVTDESGQGTRDRGLGKQDLRFKQQPNQSQTPPYPPLVRGGGNGRSPSTNPQSPTPPNTTLVRGGGDARSLSTNPQYPIPNPQSPSKAVRGVASLLATRTLVLVTAENEILDILTPQQQQKLSSRIRWEIADYWRHRRLTQSSEQEFSNRVLSGVDGRVLPAVRVFWEVMAWVQMGPVAIAANLFQESALLTSQNAKFQSWESEFPLSSLIVAPLSFIVKQLTRLDSAVAEVETKGLLVPASELTSALAYRSEALLQRVQQGLGTSGQGTPNEFSNASATDNLRIHSLIRAAIDYFFGSRKKQMPYTGSPKQPAIFSNPKGKVNRQGRHASLRSHGQPNLQLAAVDEPEPWLTQDDLFGPPTAPPWISGGRQQANQLFKTLPWGQNVTVGNSIESQITPNQSSGNISLRNRKPSSPQVTGRQRTSCATKSDKIAPVAYAGKRDSQARRLPHKSLSSGNTTFATDTNRDHTLDSIETKATPVGYVKHPLEIVLGWLDTAMLSIEVLVVKIWRWVKGF